MRWDKHVRLIFILVWLAQVLCAVHTKTHTASSSSQGHHKHSHHGHHNPNSQKQQHHIKHHTDSCTHLQDYVEQNNIGPASLVQDTKKHVPDLQICHTGSSHHKTCCTKGLENRLMDVASQDFHQSMRATSSPLKTLLSSNSAQYQETILELIQSARNHTIQELLDPYGIPVEDQLGPLNTLFMDLQLFIKRRKVNLHETVDNFFNELFPVVFYHRLSNKMARLDDDFKECLVRSRKSLRPHPFGEVPQRLAHSLTKAFSTTKALIDAVALGVEVVNTTDHLGVGNSCKLALTKLRYCPYCDISHQAAPCKGYCQNVMRGCLAGIGEIDRHWKEYIEALDKLTKNIRGIHDVELSLRNLHHRISEAIMHAMQHQHKFYPKVLETCGRPKSVPEGQDVGPTSTIATLKPSTTVADHEATFTLQKLVNNFIRGLSRFKSFYLQVADNVCDVPPFLPATQGECWNGHSIGSYTKNITAVGLTEQMEGNPEVKDIQGHRSHSQTTVTTLIDKLIHIKSELLKRVSSSMKMMNDGGFDGDSKENVYTDKNAHEKYKDGKGYQGYYSGHGGDDEDDDDDKVNDQGQYDVEFSGSGGDGYDKGSGYDWENPHQHDGRGTGVRQDPRKGNGVKSNPIDNDDIYVDDNSQPKPNNQPSGGGPAKGSVSLCWFLVTTLTLLLTGLVRE